MGRIYFGDHPFAAEFVAFDKDGTLFEFGASWRPAFLKAVDCLLASLPHRTELRRALCSTLGFEPESGTFVEHGPFATATSEAIIHAAATALYQHLKPSVPWTECEQKVRHEFAPVLAEWVELVPAADLASLFGLLHEEGIRIAVITSDDSRPTERTLDVFGLSPLVDFVACGDGSFRQKPSPDALLSASKELGIPMTATAVVGDTVADLKMARAAGAGLVVGVLSGVGGRESLAPLADVVLNSISEIRVEPIRRRR